MSTETGKIGIREAAEIIGVSRTTVLRMISENFMTHSMTDSSGRYRYKYIFDITVVWDARVRYRDWRITENPCGKKPLYLRD